MATNNATNTSKPVSISQGGTSAASMATTNGVVYYNGTDLVTTAAGTSGQVLTSNGTGSAPTYQAASANLLLIQTQTASNSASINFTTGITNTYNSYLFLFSNVVPATNTAVLHLNISTNGGSTWVNSGYSNGCWTLAYNSATLVNTNSTSTILCSGPISSTTSVNGNNGTINCYNVTSGAPFAATGDFAYQDSTNGSSLGFLISQSGTATVNAFQFIMSSGNITQGTFSLYGILE